MTELLLCFDPPVYAEDIFGRVPLDLAYRNENFSIISVNINTL